MASYKYLAGGMYPHTVRIERPFKRFHTMNAQHAHFIIYSDCHELIPEIEVWQFVSYETRICQVLHYVNLDHYVITFNDNPFGYSPSTSRQVSRWIRENEFYVSPNDIRYCYENCKPVTPEIGRCEWLSSVDVEFVSSRVMDNVWR